MPHTTFVVRRADSDHPVWRSKVEGRGFSRRAHNRIISHVAKSLGPHGSESFRKWPDRRPKSLDEVIMPAPGEAACTNLYRVRICCVWASILISPLLQSFLQLNSLKLKSVSRLRTPIQRALARQASHKIQASLQELPRPQRQCRRASANRSSRPSRLMATSSADRE